MSQLKQLVVLAALWLAAATAGAAAEQRLALVVGQGAYEAGPLATAVNDAGLVAQALTGAGFEVIQGRDLAAADLRRVVRDFLDKAEAAEPDAAIMVYLAGYGLQLEGENYLLPVDARIGRDVDIPLEGFRLSDLVRSLAGAPGAVRLVVADMARTFPTAPRGQPLAAGLALVEPPEGFLVAFSSAPNIVAPDGPGPYGAYATSLVEMSRQPGLPVEEAFSRLRLRTHEATDGRQTPWHAANLRDRAFTFFEPSETAVAAPRAAERRIDAAPPEEAYGIAVERDSIRDYQAFLQRYPDHPLARRVDAMLAARREAIVWRRTFVRDTPEAYWTYLRRYPRGPHAADARRRLARLTAPAEPPAAFDEVVYDDLPPPLPAGETVEFEEATTYLREAPPPPRAPVYLLPPRDDNDEVFVDVVRAPPPRPLPGLLPIPVPVPVPMRARPPAAYYQPIAPVTPQGAVAIPLAPPPMRGALPAQGGPRPPRPAFAPAPTVPDQPGLAAPVRTLPAAAAVPAARPADPARLPARPIPLPGQPVRPGPAAVQPLAPGVRPNQPALVPPGVRPAPRAPLEGGAGPDAPPAQRAAPVRPLPAAPAGAERPRPDPLERPRPPAPAAVQPARPVPPPAAVQPRPLPAERPPPAALSRPGPLPERAGPPPGAETRPGAVDMRPEAGPASRPPQGGGGPGRGCVLPNGQPCPR